MHKVSKGSRFNQVYIPNSMSQIFEPGDVVEIRLVKKKSELFYSKNLKKIGSFKEKLISEIFSFLKGFNGIKKVFIVGSFLTKKIDYDDIDIIIVMKEIIGIEEINKKILDLFEIKLHLLFISEEQFNKLTESCPMTICMLRYFVSDKGFILPQKQIIDKNHISFLLMMPYDLIDTSIMNGAIWKSNLRRIICIERFLYGKELDSRHIDKILENMVGKKIFLLMEKGEFLNEETIKILKKIAKAKLIKIEEIIK